MIVGHEAGIFCTPEEFEAYTAWLRDRRGWSIRHGIGRLEISEGVYVFEATPEEQRRIAAGEDWLMVLGART